jgi:hypothetical protein
MSRNVSNVLSLSPACEIPYSQQVCILRPTPYTTVTTGARTAPEMENRVSLLNGYEPIQITFLICLNFKNSVTEIWPLVTDSD